MILIGPELEQTLAAITCCCGLEINWAVLDKIERDARENQVDSKQYVLHESKHSCLTATVDDYEPETAVLRLVRGRCKQYDSIVTTASNPSFGKHPFFLDPPVNAPQQLIDSINNTRTSNGSESKFSRFRLIAFSQLNAVTRCFVGQSKIIPTPYLVCATNMRTMQTVELEGDRSKPYTIRGYR